MAPILDTEPYPPNMSATQLPPSLYGRYAYTDTLKGVYYGPGCLETALPVLLDSLGVKKAFVVTGRSVFEKVGSLAGRTTGL